MKYLWLKDDGETTDLSIEETAPHTYTVRLRDKEHTVDVRDFGRGAYNMLVDRTSLEASVLELEHHLYDVHLHDGSYQFRIVSPLQLATEGADLGSAAGAGSVMSPMPAKVVKVLVKAGDEVEQDQPVMILEAMKMQNEVLATAAGVVETVHAGEGDSVEGNALLVTITAGEQPS